MDHAHLPFCIDSLYAGCMKIEGIIKAGPEHLTLEYRMADNLLGAWAGEVTTRTIAYSELESAECRVGFFSARLVLNARGMQVFDKLPMSAPAQLSLGVPWRHRRPLRAFASEINLALSYRAADRLRNRAEGA